MFINLNSILGDIKFDRKNWIIYDVRIKIPSETLGSDTVNLNPNYSNPLCIFDYEGIKGYGIGFTLGKGNEFVCKSINFILSSLNGIKMSEVLSKQGEIYRILSNPNQLRWLSPNAGCAYMASGVILNTILDWAAKKAGLPLWKLLSLADSESLISWIDNRNFSNLISKEQINEYLSMPLGKINERINELEVKGMPAYHTTWIGSSAESIIEEIEKVNHKKGISKFKYKIHNDVNWLNKRLNSIKNNINKKYVFSVDSNQMLSFDNACKIMKLLDDNSCLWLEEPFAPDNIQLHKALKRYYSDNNASVKIATGENCPNSHVAINLIANNCLDIFQIDACRVLSICDQIPIMIGCKIYNKQLIPHAGGAGLDELVPHLQAFYLCRIDNDLDINSSIMENIGFCSHLYKNPTIVKNGLIKAPLNEGYLGGVNFSSELNKKQENEITWLSL